MFLVHFIFNALQGTSVPGLKPILQSNVFHKSPSLISDSGMGTLFSFFVVVCFHFGAESTELEKPNFKPCLGSCCLAWSDGLVFSGTEGHGLLVGIESFLTKETFLVQENIEVKSTSQRSNSVSGIYTFICYHHNLGREETV